MEYLKPYNRIDEAEKYEQSARPEARQGPRGDVDDYIFAGETWRPSER